MLINFLQFFFGLFLLYLGAEFLVRGASKIALMARISPLIVGVTVVAFGTSSPEIIVSFVAAFSKKPDLAIGNIVGSNIANIGLILGVSALIRTVKLWKTKIAIEVYWMLGASILFFLFAFNNTLENWEGLILVAALLIFIVLSVKTSIKDRRNMSTSSEIQNGKINNLAKPLQIIIYVFAVIAGIIILIWGSNITIDSAVFIAREFGISEIIIGLTLVAFGTSLPELATALISIIKKENAILIGNVIGSNIFNILCVGGLVSSFIEIPVKDRVINFDLPVMIFVSVLILPVVYKWNKIPRVFGIFLLLIYFSYITFSFFNLA